MTIGEQAADIARSDVVSSAVKSLPPVSVAGMHWFGIQLPDLVMAATLIYTVLQVIALIRDKFWLHRRKHKKE
ncbi:hypothetical protein G3N58_17505 [Paraburkholderia sp. Ac-20342]|uniref:hypothetical protein n=1 Tax=Paraburkholderia sp. Ac-20342 TaxID=2703889 RepID=UPI0019812A06|nr:hypothetical protein [Paraburkholderia sp. Ac-20342]MBN3848605.1 hypothetical protein [Paraburkholderia sp. Ac-20342]